MFLCCIFWDYLVLHWHWHILQQQGCGVLALPNGVYVLCYNPNKRLNIVLLIYAIFVLQCGFCRRSVGRDSGNFLRTKIVRLCWHCVRCLSLCFFLTFPFCVSKDCAHGIRVWLLFPTDCEFETCVWYTMDTTLRPSHHFHCRAKRVDWHGQSLFEKCGRKQWETKDPFGWLSATCSNQLSPT